METRCPANHDWWDKDQFRRYYQDQPRSPDLICKHNPAPPIEARTFINEVECASFAGERWRRLDILPEWEKGSFGEQQGDKPIHLGRSHWHTSFNVDKREVHIDFIGFSTMGPQTQYREYRIFIDQQELGRGGGFLGFLMAVHGRLRNWPIAVRFNSSLIYINQLLQFWTGSTPGEIENADVLKVWQLYPQSLND